MTDLLARERLAAKRLLDARRAQLANATILDEFMLRYAHDLAASQPRCDYTIAQLPSLSSALSGDLVPIFHNGQTYGIPVSALPVISSLAANVNVTGIGVFNVKYYGAKGDGATDDTLAIQNAITAAYNAGGGKVFFPPGTYIIISGQISLSNGVDLIGLGREFTTLKLGLTSTATSIILNATALTNVRISGLTFDLNNVSNVSAIQIQGAMCNTVAVEDCVFKNGTVIWMVNIGGVGTTTQYSTNMAFRRNIVGPSSTGSAEAALLVAWSDSQVEGNVFTGNSSTSASLGIYAYHKNVLLEGNVFTGNRSSYYVQQSTFVTCRGNTHSAAATSGTQVQVINCQDIAIEDTIIGNVNASAIGIHDFSGGTFDGHTALYQNTRRVFIDCYVEGAYAGVSFPSITGTGNNTAQSEITVSGIFAECAYAAVNVPAQNAGTGISGLRVRNLTVPNGGWGQGSVGAIQVSGSANTGEVTIEDCYIGSSTAGGVGIALTGSGFNTTVVRNVDLTHAGGSGINPYALSSGAVFKRVENTPGINDTVGALTAPALPATGVSLTNPFPYPVDVIITGGTVTNINYGPSSTAVATTATGGVFRLEVGWVINVSYSVAPTWKWIAH